VVFAGETDPRLELRGAAHYVLFASRNRPKVRTEKACSFVLHAAPLDFRFYYEICMFMRLPGMTGCMTIW
jgi:hypothetical protein